MKFCFFFSLQVQYRFPLEKLAMYDLYYFLHKFNLFASTHLGRPNKGFQDFPGDCLPSILHLNKRFGIFCHSSALHGLSKGTNEF